jgi:hypothetical protein
LSLSLLAVDVGEDADVDVYRAGEVLPPGELVAVVISGYEA